MHFLVWLALVVAAVTAAPPTAERIVGGSATNIGNWPDICSLGHSATQNNFRHSCGGIIINQQSILSAAHCFHDARNNPNRWRVRVGSTNAHSGGVQHRSNAHRISPCYNRRTYDCDIMVMRLATRIAFNNNARAGRLASANYNLRDNEVVWAAGWGATREQGPSVEQLRHVQIWTISQAICRQRYGQARITDNMLCSGWLDVGGRDQCQGDSGGPLYHNRNVVGVCSWGNGCGRARYPGVNARVSRFVNWISAQA